MTFSTNAPVEFLTGAAAAVVDCCLFHSIDTLKVRAQDRRPLLPWPEIKSARMISRPGIAFASLYQGFSTNLFLKVPYMATMFGFYSLNRTMFDSLPKGSVDPTTKELLSALLVGLEASLVLSPLELIRIQGQNRGKGGLVAASRFVLQEVGLVAVLRTGLHACMQREAKYCLGQFAAIGALSRHLERWAADARAESAAAALLHDHPDLGPLASSITVGFLCTIVSHPDDVVKTRQQTRLPTVPEYRSYVSSLAHVAAVEGVGGLWRGAFWRCCVRVPLGLAVINFVHPRIRPHVEAALS